MKTLEALTIYARKGDLAPLSLLDGDISASTWEEVAEGDTTSRGVAHHRSGTLTVSVMPSAKGGQFLGQLLGSISWAEQRYGVGVERDLLTFLSEVRLVVGTTYQPPATTPEDPRLRAVATLAAVVDGILFDGLDFLSPAATDLIRTGRGVAHSWRTP